MSIFSSSSHLECFERDLPNDHTCLVWFSGFRGEDLNVKVYDAHRMPNDGKSSHGLWPGELIKREDLVLQWHMFHTIHVMWYRGYTYTVWDASYSIIATTHRQFSTILKYNCINITFNHCSDIQNIIFYYASFYTFYQ